MGKNRDGDHFFIISSYDEKKWSPSLFFIGIDVGARKYFISWYSKTNRQIQVENKLTDKRDVVELIQSKKNCIIAIDCSQAPCIKGEGRREAEKRLSISGYFATPDKKGKMRPWMRSGIELFEALKRKGYKLASEIKRGNLIEVYPTLIFKKLNSNLKNPEDWIRTKEPKNKIYNEGRASRKQTLAKLFKGQSDIINRLTIDYIDALIAAYTCQMYDKGKVIFIGDAKEGQICFPDTNI